jgi:hypothetical protein
LSKSLFIPSESSGNTPKRKDAKNVDYVKLDIEEEDFLQDKRKGGDKPKKDKHSNP